MASAVEVVAEYNTPGSIEYMVLGLDLTDAGMDMSSRFYLA